ncbi:MAG TPA: PH domain-containing protein [Gaiellaceae bacterium]|nr:PH domain-containing protein [Gaiellaceae bacterium]
MSDDWRGISRRYLTLRRLEVVAVAVVAAIVFAIFLNGWYRLWIAGALAAGVFGLVIVQRRFVAWGYAERADDLLVKRGVLFARLSVVPYGRMQFIDVTAGPFERLFRIATVRMHTAAAASDARIPGLESHEAARLRDRLAELGESQAAGI